MHIFIRLLIINKSYQAKKPFGNIFPSLSRPFLRFFCLKFVRTFFISLVFHPKKSRILDTYFYYRFYSCSFRSIPLSPKKFRVYFLALMVLKSSIFYIKFSYFFLCVDCVNLAHSFIGCSSSLSSLLNLSFVLVYEGVQILIL